MGRSGLFSVGKRDYFQEKERVTPSAVSPGLPIPHIMPILGVSMWIFTPVNACTGAVQGLRQAVLKHLGPKALPVSVLAVSSRD